jgi:hypothetical protein
MPASTADGAFTAMTKRNIQIEYSGFPRQDSQRALVLTRIFDAPRLVWRA